MWLEAWVLVTMAVPFVDRMLERWACMCPSAVASDRGAY